MKDHLLALINQMDEIEKLFHHEAPSPGLAMPDVDEIYDVQAFQIWKKAVALEVQDIVDRTKDKFASDTLTSLSKSSNGWNDRRAFDDIKGGLLAMRDNIDKYYVPVDAAGNDKTPKVFISHSSKDKDYVAKIVSLFDDMGLKETDIFCSSLAGYGIPIDTNIFDFLRNQFQHYNLHVIIVHSDNYYQSAVSLNEMGAAWVLRTKCTSFLLPGFGFDKMTGVVNGNAIAIKLDSKDNDIDLKDKLNQLYDIFVDEFSLHKKASILWEQKRDSFIDAIHRMTPDANTTAMATVDHPMDEDDDLELTEGGYYIRKSEAAAGKDIRYCAACKQNFNKLSPLAKGSMARDMFCTNCKAHYTR